MGRRPKPTRSSWLPQPACPEPHLPSLSADSGTETWQGKARRNWEGHKWLRKEREARSRSWRHAHSPAGTVSPLMRGRGCQRAGQAPAAKKEKRPVIWLTSWTPQQQSIKKAPCHAGHESGCLQLPWLRPPTLQPNPGVCKASLPTLLHWPPRLCRGAGPKDANVTPAGWQEPSLERWPPSVRRARSHTQASAAHLYLPRGPRLLSRLSSGQAGSRGTLLSWPPCHGSHTGLRVPGDPA